MTIDIQFDCDGLCLVSVERPSVGVVSVARWNAVDGLIDVGYPRIFARLLPGVVVFLAHHGFGMT
jgi:hypothetical protein